MKLKKWQNASTEDRKRKKNSFFTKQKLGPVRTYSHRNRVFKSRKHQTVVHIKILRLPFQEGVSNYLIT